MSTTRLDSMHRTSWLRKALLSALLGALSTLLPSAAAASPAEEADKLSAAGKKEFSEKRYLEAYRLFKRATELSPEGRYYFNVCFTLNYLERYQEAIDACEQVEPNGADEKLLEKTRTVLAALRQKVPQHSTDPNTGDPNTGDPNTGDPNTGDPNTGDPNTGDPNASPTGPGENTSSLSPAAAPEVDPFAVQQTAPQGYQWSLGASLRGLANRGIGRMDDFDIYNSGGGGLLLFSNFIFSEEQRLGLQGYLGWSNFDAQDPSFDDPLQIFDFGAAAYKHIGLGSSLDFTPLVGAHISLFEPVTSLDEGLLTIGARLQAGFDWSFGAAKEHVLSVAPSLNLYLPAADGNTGLVASDYGLDHGAASVEFGIGYQYRFSTPFGSGPLFTLE